MKLQSLFILFTFLHAFLNLVITPSNRPSARIAESTSRELYGAPNKSASQSIDKAHAFAKLAEPKSEARVIDRKTYLREKARRMLLDNANGLKGATHSQLKPVPRRTSLTKSSPKAQTNESRRLALRNLKKILGKRMFLDLASDLKRKRIDITKLDSKDLDYLNQLYHRNYLMQRKLPRMPGGLLPGPIESAHIDSNYKEVSGGSFALRLPNLPQVVMVNQSPYYQY